MPTGNPDDLLMPKPDKTRMEIPLRFGVNLLMMAMRRGQMIYPMAEAS